MRFAYLQCGSTELAQDVVQDVVVDLLRHRARLEREVEVIDAYSRRAVVNRLRSVWRHRAVQQAHPVPPPAVVRHDDAVVEDLDLQRRLARLPARQRAAVVLRYYEDYSHRDIAVVLGCTESSARSLLTRALQSLRATAPETHGAPR
nr:sigma-70 family RNA polymerase sigma factor [Nocardioides sp. zg-DK7169]